MSDSLELNGRRALVTGGTKIGKAVAVRLRGGRCEGPHHGPLTT